MSHSRNQDAVSEAFADKQKLSVLVEQFIADIAQLDTETLSVLSRIAEGPENDCTQVATVSAHLRKTPNRLKAFLLAATPSLPYYRVFKPIDVYSPRYILHEVGEVFIQRFGESRMILCLAYLIEKRIKDQEIPANAGAKKPHEAISVKPAPTDELITESISIFESSRMPFSTTLQQDLTKRAMAAEAALIQLKVEHEQQLADRRKASDRELTEHRRGKEKAATEAKETAERTFNKERKTLQDDVKKLADEVERLQEQLREAKASIKVGGITEKDLEQVRAEIQKEFDDRYETKIDETIRPWMNRLKQAETSYLQAKDALKLSDQAIEMARSEAAKDQLCSWESEPLAALPLIERRLAEVDELINRTIVPSPALLKIHKDLRSAMDTCRAHVERIRKAKPDSLMVKAIGATIKQLGIDNLKQIAASVNDLTENKVLTDAEDMAISKMINEEIGLRAARKELDSSPKTLLLKDLHNGKPVDILVDAYNFMHIAKQHFAKFAKPSEKDPSKTIFGPPGRAKIADMFKVLPLKFKKTRVVIFLDGQTLETRKPHDGVSFRLPIVQRTGEGQADAEIIDYIQKEARREASVYIISNDKQLQQTANLHLSIGVCCGILDEI
jgi:hypothetical protein